MALPMAIKGGTRPSPLITWYQDNTTTPETLTGATLTGFIYRGSGQDTVAIEGNLTVIDGPGGIFRWDLDAADVAEAGNFYVQFVATFASGQSPAKTFATRWRVAEALAVTP